MPAVHKLCKTSQNKAQVNGLNTNVTANGKKRPSQFFYDIKDVSTNSLGMTLFKPAWPNWFNRLRTGVGDFRETMCKWGGGGVASIPNRDCGAKEQSTIQIITSCPTYCCRMELIKNHTKMIKHWHGCPKNTSAFEDFQHLLICFARRNK